MNRSNSKLSFVPRPFQLALILFGLWLLTVPSCLSPLPDLTGFPCSEKNDCGPTLRCIKQVCQASTDAPQAGVDAPLKEKVLPEEAGLPKEAGNEETLEKLNDEEPRSSEQPRDGGGVEALVPEEPVEDSQSSPEKVFRENTTNVKITMISGTGSSTPVDYGGKSKPSDAIESKKRFADRWELTGENLDKIEAIRLESALSICNGKKCVFGAGDGLSLQQGDSKMRTLLLPPKLVAGLFLLVATISGSQYVLAQTFVLQGESGIDAKTRQYLKDLQNHVKLNPGTNKNLVSFEGVNVRIVNGSGNTNTVNSLGNLTIGYNKATTPQPNPQLTGSHNLIVGDGHSYTSYGGVVFGLNNTSSNTYAIVTGGQSNIASGSFSSISGGRSNKAVGSYSSILGGHTNTASGDNSSVSGGQNNTAGGNFASVSGGGGGNKLEGNQAKGDYASISGGVSNVALGNQSSVSGGLGNKTYGVASSISGGTKNSAGSLGTTTGLYASVSGGNSNNAIGSSSSISGGLQNTASGLYSSVSGGFTNKASGAHSSVLGGDKNDSSGNSSSISGGNNNTATKNYSSVAGGSFNSSDGVASSIAGGNFNTATGRASTISGGSNNSASGICSSVSGGGGSNKTDGNQATGDYSSILGGAKKSANSTTCHPACP